MRTARKRGARVRRCAFDLLESRKLLAAFDMIKAGDWSDPTVWSLGRLPGAGDTVTVDYPLTISQAATVGTSSPGVTALSIKAPLTIADGASLTLDGNVVQDNGVVVTGQGKGQIRFDSTHAADPTTCWTWQIGNGYFTSSDYPMLVLRGTASERFLVTSAAGGGNGRFTNSGNYGSGGVDAQYSDFVAIGDASNPAFAPWLENRSLTFALNDCRIIQCGAFGPVYGVDPTASFIINDCAFIKPLVSGQIANVGPGTPTTGTWQITNNVFDSAVSLSLSPGWTISGNTYRAGGFDQFVQAPIPPSPGPFPALAYTISGPNSLTLNAPSTFAVALSDGTTSPGETITPSDGGAGGTFSPQSLTLTTAAPSGQFTYTPGAIGPVVISTSDDGDLLAPGPLQATTTIPAVTYSFAAPSPATSLVGAPSDPFTVSLATYNTLASPVTVTPSDGGAGGTFTPASVTLSTASPSAAFTYTAASSGPKTITVASGGALADPLPVVLSPSTDVVTTYTLVGPGRGDVTVPSDNFTVSLGPGVIAGSIQFTPAASNGDGGFTPSSVVLTNSVRTATFSYTPTLWGSRTISITNDGGLADPAPLSFLGMVHLGSSGTALSGNESPSLGGFNLLGNGGLAELSRNITGDPTDPNATALVDALSGLNLHVDFSSTTNQGGNSLYGIPINIVSGNQPTKTMTVDLYYSESDVDQTTHQAQVPIPWDPSIEGYYDPAGNPPTSCPSGMDQHMLIAVRDEATGGIDTIWEASNVYSTDGGVTWHCHALAKFDLTTGALRTDTYTSADAAGLPILPLLVRYDEVASGSIDHAIRVTINAGMSRNAYQWPARHSVSVGSPDSGLPMGSRLRLSQAWYDANRDSFTGQARVILDAMYNYGMIVADIGSSFFFSGVSDSRWDLNNLLTLQSVPASAFQVDQIQPGLAVTGPTSGILGQPVTYTVTRIPVNDQNYGAGIYGVEDGVLMQDFANYAVLTPATPVATVTYTPSVAGTHTLNFLTGSADWIPAPAITFTAFSQQATTYQLVGPSGTSILVNQPLGPFIVTPNGITSGTITPSDQGAGGTFSPASLTWSGTAQPQSFTYTPASAGSKTISVTNSAGLLDPASLSFTVTNPRVATTVKDGNWNDPTVWNNGIVPGVGDLAVIDNSITITSNTTVGDGSASTVLDCTVGTLTVLGAQLTIRGNATFGYYNSGAVRSVLAVRSYDHGSGMVAAGIELDGNSGVTPVVEFASDTSITITGTPSARCFIRTTAGAAGNPGYWTNDPIEGGVRSLYAAVSYCDFARLGDGTHYGFQSGALDGTAANPVFTFDHCTFDSCYATPYVALPDDAGATQLSFTNCVWTNAVAGAQGCMSINANASALTTGTRLVDSCVFFAMAGWFSPRDVSFTNNYFDEAPFCYGEQQFSAKFDGNFVRRSTSTIGGWDGNLTNNFWLALNTQTSSYMMLDGQDKLGSPTLVSGNVCQYIGPITGLGNVFFGDTEGNPSQGTSTNHTLTLEGNLVLPPQDGGSMSLMEFNSNISFTRTNYEVFDHNTVITATDNATSMGSVIGQKSDTLLSFRSNILYNTGTSTGNYAIDNFGLAPALTPVDAAAASSITNNALFGFDTVPSGAWSGSPGDTGVEAGTAYNLPMSGSMPPGANDVHADPQFADPTRNLLTWDASLGGAGTLASALARIQSDPSLTRSSLLPWIELGYVPTNPTLKGAAYDGTDIGAVQTPGPGTLPPLTPSTPGLAPASDSGQLGDGITNVRQPFLIGSATPGLTVQIQIIGNPTVLGSAVTDSSGHYSVEFTSPLADGTYNVVVRAVDAAGNASLPSAAYSLTILATPPSPPSAPLLSAADATGAVGDGVTSVRQPHLLGTATPGTTVEIVDGLTVYGSAITDSNGEYSVTIATPLTDGIYSFEAVAVDVAGNTSVASYPFSLIELSIPAKYVQTVATAVEDTTTQGNWIGTYGADGASISEDISVSNPTIPSYATLALSGPQGYGWTWSTSDPRALQQAGNPTNRVAGCWYSSTSFTIDINLTDGQTHQVAIYALDWDNSNRKERVDVVDPATGAVLDSHTLSSFSGGQYLVWNLSGHVQLRVTDLAGPNAVVSGVFFGAGKLASGTVSAI